LWYVGAYLLHASIGDGRPSLYTEGNSEDDARLSARAYTSSGKLWAGVDGLDGVDGVDGADGAFGRLFQ